MYWKTPLLKSRIISEQVSLQRGSKTNVWLKLENIQPSGSFKLRGISNCILKVNCFLKVLQIEKSNLPTFTEKRGRIQFIFLFQWRY
jgi:threonine dehydratase